MSTQIETPIDKNQYLFQFKNGDKIFWMVGTYDYNLNSFVNDVDRYPVRVCMNWYRLDSVLSLLQEKEQRRLTYTELIRNKRVVINPDEKITKEAAEYLANYVLQNHVGSSRYPGINLIAACDRVLSWCYGHLTPHAADASRWCTCSLSVPTNTAGVCTFCNKQRR